MNYEIGLFDHNAKAYEAVKESFKNKDRVCIIHATGTGKSFIALQLIYDFVKKNPNKKVVYLTPLNGIKNQVQDHVKNIERHNKERGLEFHKEYFDNVEFISYAFVGGKAKNIENLDTMSRKELSNVEADLLIVDEFHHIGKGADNWKAGVDLIIASNPKVKIFGMSATSIRYMGTSKEEDVANTFFDGNIASKYSLEQAIVDGTLAAPNYHAAFTFLEEECAELENKVKNGNASIEEKNEYEKILRDIKNKIASMEEKSVQDIIKKYLKANGKYIYFCPGGGNVIELQNRFLEMLPIEVRKNVEFYRVNSSMYSNAFNEQMAYDFYNNITSSGESAKEKLRVMFAIDMYNEGIHVPDIDGIIMGRSTSSDIIFYQQLGRVLSVKKKSDNEREKIEPPLVIDLQDNFRKILKLYNKVKKEENAIVSNDKTITNENSNVQNSVFYSFGISDEIIDIVSELNKIRGSINDHIGFKASLKAVYNFVQSNGKLPSLKTKSEEEKKLVNWFYQNKRELLLLTIRQDSEKHQFSRYEEEYVEMANVIVDKQKENDSESKFKASLKAVYNFVQSSGKFPNTRAKNSEEKKLGNWLNKNKRELVLLAMRQNSEKHQFLEYEEEYVEMANVIANMKKENDSEFKFKASLKAVYDFVLSNEKLPNTRAKNSEEKKLGKWLSNNRKELLLLLIRQDSEKHQFSKYEEEYVEMANIIADMKKENDSESKFKASLKTVYDFVQSNGKLPSRNVKNEEEKKLGSWLHDNTRELLLLLIRQDSEKHHFLEYEEEYVEMANVIVDKQKENDSEFKFKASLKAIYNFVQSNEKLPSRKVKNEEEKKLGNWFHRNTRELLLLAIRQNSEKHQFLEYEEEYVEMANVIASLRGWITLEESRKQVHNEQIFINASLAVVSGKPQKNKASKGEEYGREI